jgi:hypothetical protein
MSRAAVCAHWRDKYQIPGFSVTSGSFLVLVKVESTSSFFLLGRLWTINSGALESIKRGVPPMIFYTKDNKAVVVDFANFSHIPPGTNLAFTPVAFKDGTVEWIKAAEEEIRKAVNEPSQ